ncbi:MAG: threonylcarbamoyl-AMP synthase [Methylococcaceae bacterium]|nr:MAG: threonylcarbamoyl-AMP synthase [Methylococcaceae bacterium]
MTQFIQIHPDDPQSRLIEKTVERLRQGALIVYPTDSGYALGCQLDDKEVLERLKRLRQLDDRYQFTLCCADLAQAARFGQIPNAAFRLMKSLLPGPFTFILKASKEVPRRLQQPKRKTIGVRVPANEIAKALVAALDEPMVTATLILPGEEEPMPDPYDIKDQLANQVDILIDGGYLPYEPTTVVDMTDDVPAIVRQGKALVPGLS